MAIFPLVGSVNSCKVSPEVWLSTLRQTSDPGLACKVSFSKLMMMMKLPNDVIHLNHSKNLGKIVNQRPVISIASNPGA